MPARAHVLGARGRPRARQTGQGCQGPDSHTPMLRGNDHCARCCAHICASQRLCVPWVPSERAGWQGPFCLAPG